MLRLHKIKNMKKNFFEKTSENEVELREELKKWGIAPEVVDALEYGTYVYDGNSFCKLSKAELLAHENPEYGVIAVAAYAAGVGVISRSNAKLNTKRYGEPTGFGYAFEDLNNRALRKAGYKVDSSIGKKEDKGGPDAKVTDKEGRVFYLQYKCYKNSVQAARCIVAKGGYRNQEICINPEIFEGLKKELRMMESKGKVSKGTAERVHPSPITYDESKKMAAPFDGRNRESLKFDAGTASKTGVVVALVAASVAFAIHAKKEGRINKKVVKKTLGWGLGLGALAFLAHIGINQSERFYYDTRNIK